MVTLFGYLFIGVIAMLFAELLIRFVPGAKKGLIYISSKEAVYDAIEQSEKKSLKNRVMFNICSVILWPIFFSFALFIIGFYYYKTWVCKD